MNRSTIAKAFTIAAVTAVALGLAPTANAHDKGCSNATLKGTFAEKGTGVITNPSPRPFLFSPVSIWKPSTEMAQLRLLDSPA